MIKKLTLTLTTALFFVGCGGGGNPTPKSGAYNLWEYIAPVSSKTDTFTLSSNSVDTTYKSTYKVVNQARVEEVADYAKDEKTIYEKSNDKIIIKFEKNGKPNGFYELKLTADIGDIVTKRDSTCKLAKHHDSFSIAGKSFQDVIEITCNNIPGYYQKGVGEVAQKEDNTGKNIRVLSN